MLCKIDCIMIRVDDVEKAAAYYAQVFGLRPQWSGDEAIGLVFPESDAEVVLHNDPNIPSPTTWLMMPWQPSLITQLRAAGSWLPLSTLPSENAP